MNKTLKDAMEQSLSGIEFDEQMSRNVLKRIKLSEGENEHMKKKVFASAAVAVLFVLLAVGAFAAVYISGTIDWAAKPVQQNDSAEPMPTVLPTNSPTELPENQIAALASGKPRNELGLVQYADGSGELLQATEEIVTLDGLKTRLRLAGSPLMVPEAPAGYKLAGGELNFYYTGQTLQNVKLAETKEPFAGATLSRYLPGEDSQWNIAGYSVLFEDGAGNGLRVLAELTNSGNTNGFGVGPDDNYETVTVTGMEKALYIGRKGIDNSLYLLDLGIAPIRYKETLSLDPITGSSYAEDTYDAASYSLTGTAISKEDLLSMVKSLK